ncbi:MAG: hypothetical protein VX044_08690 [Planctomycetota bacterium]|nr:hypothetical protein [Planctomycetota bacterium]
MTLTRSIIAAVIATVAVDFARAQVPQADYQLQNGAFRARKRDDYYEVQAQGGVRFVVDALGLTVRGESLLILHDLETMQEAIDRGRQRGLPTRALPNPAPRRRLSPEAVRQRLERTLAAVGRAPSTQRAAPNAVDAQALRLFRYLYCEGDIVVVQRGVEVLRCDRMWISPIDDRVVVENAELRYQTANQAGEQQLVVRGPRLVKQGPRWIGQDLTLTTCTAATPHAALHVGEAEIIERDGEFEVVARGQTIQAGGIDLVPVPDARVFTGSQSEFPIKSASGGYSNALGAQLGVVFGTPWNQTGGALHNWLTGRPAAEFRGEWQLGVGWIQERGTPLEPRITYGAPGLYEGWTEGFYIDDAGRNVREIRTNLDGSAIGDTHRSVVRTANRVHLGAKTHLDVQAFHASDAAVYSEFFIDPYRADELPETSAYLHHADDNHLLTVGTRFNLSDFSYRDDRFLADRFIEELPVLTYQWLAQPVAETPWETPIVLDLETQVGQRRSNYDDRAAVRTSDRTLRADQQVELSAPFHVGAFSVRPYVSGRGTFYDNTLSGVDDARVALEAGLQIGTRLSRTWRWVDEQGAPDAVRHVVAPRLTYRNRYHVDDRPADLFQFDDVNPTRLAQLGYDTADLLEERELLRFEVRNLFQKMDGEGASRQPRDFVFVDLAQDLLPNSERDNDGETLGLFFYDVLLRPTVDWLPFETFAVAHYGDLDWEQGMQTMDTELTVGPIAGFDWAVEYREDSLFDGVLGLGARTTIFDRWTVFGRAQRDLQRDEFLNYSFGLRRRDHDWIIGLTAAYNPFIEEVTFRLDFQPTFGGMSGRRNRFGGAVANDRMSYDY